MTNLLGFRVNSPTVSKTCFSKITFLYHLEMSLRLWLSAWPHVAVVANVDLGSQLIAGFWAGVPLYLGWSAHVLTSGNLENPIFYFGRLAIWPGLQNNSWIFWVRFCPRDRGEFQRTSERDWPSGMGLSGAEAPVKA